MSSVPSYARKISSEEAKEEYILVLKNKLSFFPPRNTLFEMTAGTLRKKVAVESYRCTCQGPDEPHEHYFIQWKGLKAGDRLTITKGAGLSGYRLVTHR
jgi:hypothetical protein